VKKSTEVRERIIEATIDLIQESNGDANEVTTRAIAERADVVNSLINYHFQTKENLITICVQRIIGQVISNFTPSSEMSQNVQERLTNVTAEVFEFLFANPAISRISILNDLTAPTQESNTARSQSGVQKNLGNSLDEADKKNFSFVLVSAMQAAFLSRAMGMACTGYDLEDSSGRSAFISNLVNMLFHGIKG